MGPPLRFKLTHIAARSKKGKRERDEEMKNFTMRESEKKVSFQIDSILLAVGATEEAY